MVSSLSRRLMGGGMLAAILAPLALNLLVRPAAEKFDYLLDLGAAGPFEVLADGQAGRPISTASKGASFAWTFRYCLQTDLPAIEIVELRRLRDDQVITRASNAIAAGPDRCVQSTATQRIPIDAQSGVYELVRRVAVHTGKGASISTAISSIPIEVVP